MPFDAIAVANKLFDIARERGEGLDPLKILKLVYFAHGWHLALTGQPLLTQRVEAWKYGPVVRSLYHAVKACGLEARTDRVTVLKVEPHSKQLRLVAPSLDDDRPDEASKTFVEHLLERIWAVYGSYTGIVLSNATHLPGSPWDVTRKRTRGAKHAVIPDDLIREDFLERAHAHAGGAR